MISTGHLWMVGILLVLVLIIFGPGKLPDIGSALGRGIREFRSAGRDVKDEVGGAVKNLNERGN